MSLLLLSAVTLIKIIPYVVLIFLPFRKYFRYSLTHTSLLTLLFITTTIAVSYYVLPSGSTLLEWRLFYLISISIFGLLLSITIIRTNLFKILFNFFVVLCYLKDFDYYSLYLQSYIFSNWHFGIDIGAMIFCNLLLLLFTFPFMWLFMTELMTPLVENENQDASWGFLWTIPFIFYMLYRVGMTPGDYLTTAFLFSKNSLPYHLVGTTATFLSFTMILKMLKSSEANAALNHKLATADLRLDLQRKEYQRLTKAIDDTRQAKHDLRHHFIVLKHFLTKNDLPALSEYLNNYIKALDQTIALNICSNTAGNAIIQYYYNLALNKDIAMNIDVNIPATLAIEEDDLSVLLGNIFENALEACERQTSNTKFIKVKADTLGDNMFVLTVKNSFDHVILLSEQGFISSKRDNEGIGTESIKNIAERYNGIAKFTYHNNIFETSVFLNPTSLSSK
ncbi:MAG TPA: sensor histidine kinase [Candidatus Avacidaminococcus intestinavium]|uniref:Sensor histidine kinase n=1 Tax=Candidatus Avacidaminococcus intestinavium TaxID=2840684 RepID=A0A9D1MPQ3_9FIRM|nr:sensor histidine kinase [Candidatus Avacidaminococcus intestinavium]